MKVYGASICIDCRNFMAMANKRGLQIEYVDITDNTHSLKEFLHIRDTSPIFTKQRKEGGIGIPLFVSENGELTLDVNTALSWIGQPAVTDDEYPEKLPFEGCETCN